MKKFCIISFICITYNLSYAQVATTVYTPNGSVVTDTYLMPENLSSYDIYTLTNQVKQAYPNATILSSATSTYNCHAYAWHMSEGGSPVWMGANSNPTSIYWRDGSYLEVPQNQATKVSYSNDNHSAITTDQNDIFISKWGSLPLMKHAKDDCPYNATNLKYYVRQYSISGPDLVCECENPTFSISNLPEGTYVTWHLGGSFSSVSGQGTANATFTISDASNTSEFVSATGSYNGKQLPIQGKWVHVGNPETYDIIYDDSDISAWQSVPVEVQFEGAEHYSWSPEDNNCSISPLNDDWSIVSITPYTTGSVTAIVTASNRCGSTSEWITLYVDDSQNLRSNDEHIVSIYTLTNQLVYSTKKESSTFNINDLNLKRGYYVIKRTQNKKVERALIYKQ